MWRWYLSLVYERLSCCMIRVLRCSGFATAVLVLALFVQSANAQVGKQGKSGSHSDPRFAGPASTTALLAEDDADLGDQLFKLVADDCATDDRFGISVAINSTTAIVGAYLDDDNGTDSGSAYLFDATAPGMCPWDLDGNGAVGVSDLLLLLAS